MQRLSMVMLEHATRSGRHFDWLFERPDAGDERPLVCFRTDRPSSAWDSQRGPLMMERLADHRRRYLVYQGPIGGDRGRVRRVDRGTVLVRRWSGTEAVLDLSTERFKGRLALRRVDRERWRGRVLRPASTGIIMPASGPYTSFG